MKIKLILTLLLLQTQSYALECTDLVNRFKVRTSLDVPQTVQLLEYDKEKIRLKCEEQRNEESFTLHCKGTQVRCRFCGPDEYQVEIHKGTSDVSLAVLSVRYAPAEEVDIQNMIPMACTDNGV